MNSGQGASFRDFSDYGLNLADRESDSANSHPTKTPITVYSRNQISSQYKLKYTVTRTNSETLLSESPPTDGSKDPRESPRGNSHLIPFANIGLRNKIDNIFEPNQILQNMRVEEEEDSNRKWICIWGLDEQTIHKVWELLQSWLQDRYKYILDVRRIEQRIHERIRYDVCCVSTEFFSILNVTHSCSKEWKIFAKESLPFLLRKKKSQPKEFECQKTIRKDPVVKVKFATWNIRSINKRRNEIEYFFDVENIAVLAIQETWRFENKWCLRLNNFSCIESLGKKDNKGHLGVALAVRNDLSLYGEGQPSPYLVCGKIGSRDLSPHWYFISVYIPLKVSGVRENALEDLRRLLVRLSEKTERGPIIAMGDWNMSEKQLSITLKKWKLPFSVLPTSGSNFSRYSGNTITALDFIVCSHDGRKYLSKARVNRKWKLSDHWPVTARIHQYKNNQQQPVRPEENSNLSNTSRFNDIKFDNIANLKRVYSLIRIDGKLATHITEEPESDNLNRKVEKFVETIIEISSECGAISRPKSLKNGKKKKSCNLSKGTKRKIDERRGIEKEISKLQLQPLADIGKLEKLKEKLKQVAQDAKTLINQDRAEIRNHYKEKLFSLALTRNPKGLWDELRKLANPSKGK